MEYQRQILRWGTACIVLAVALRLLSAGFFQPAVNLLRRPETASFLLYMETGRKVHFKPLPAVEETPPAPTDPVDSTPPENQPEREELTFAEEDLVEVMNHTGFDPDYFTLLTQPLSWSANSAGPTVLIVHTHATETYTGDDISYSGSYRTLDREDNMVSIGEEIARVLTAGGISVLHDRTLHDHPSYNSAYDNSRETIAEYLQKYPSVRMVLDIHRDASPFSGGELITSATVGGQRSAQLMMVVGTQSSKWQENLSLALKLGALLEQENPGICRPVNLRSERFNVDLSPGSLLVEVGATGNTHEEAIIAANALAQSVLELIKGTESP